MANVLVEIYSHDQTTIKNVKSTYFILSGLYKIISHELYGMQRGRGVFIANPPQNAFLFFVMLQRCTSSIRGSADSVKFYIVFFFFKLQAILYFSQCITIAFACSYSTVRNLC